MAKSKVFQEFARGLQALANCNNAEHLTEWSDRWATRLEHLVQDQMPSGSGIDCGTKLDFDKSSPDRLVFNTSFHHMDEHGGYDGWTDHAVIVRPSLAHGFDLRITGRDRNQIKDYLAEIYQGALDADFDEWRD